VSTIDNLRIVELFAGPGGWAEGLRLLGFTGAVVGLDNSRDACITATRAGHPRIECDVQTFPVAMFAPGLFGFIASPPCQSFSMAGKRGGEEDRQHVMDLVDLHAIGRDAPDLAWADERSRLTAQPMRWIARLAPDWVAMEQVPGVLSLWEHMAKRLVDLGYFTWTGIVNAEEYGVPQTRRRAVLLAARGFVPTAPVPTHQRYRRDGDYSGSPLPAPVTMAEALGWGLNDRPAWTVTSGGTDTGGAEVFGNARNRAKLVEVVQRSNYSRGTSDGSTAEERGRTERRPDEPSVTLTGKAFQWEMRFAGAGATAVKTSGQIPRDLDEPAHAVTGVGSAAWVSDTGVHRARVSVAEAGVLQTFPVGYPWTGTKGSQYQQVGNAVPPRMAAALLEQFVRAR
jgi:DNA (cytosine-5)-methyltransferase 1